MARAADLTGRERMTWNVLSSWAGHFVHIIAGFVLPRLIDDRLGQDRLGVWDFAWSFVAYFGLVQGGVISSINRYVAKFWGAGDIRGVNRVVSSVNCVLFAMAGLTILLAFVAAFLMTEFWSGGLGSFVRDAQWVTVLLGFGLAFEVATSGYAGVVTGCHRWDLHNALHGMTCVLSTVGMIAAVALGGNLAELALANVAGEVIGRTLRCLLAYRICPGLSVRPRHADWATAREMLSFGGKSFVPQMGDLLLNQTVSVLVAGSLGAGALAVFSRPRSLIRHVGTLVSKLALVLTPTASSLQATQQHDRLCELFIKGTRYAAYLTLPAILALTLLGDLILLVWMGPHYADGTLLAILALGSLAPITQQPAIGLLSGLNAHGRVGVANLVASIAAVALAVLAIELGWGLEGAALAVSIPLTIANGVYVPLSACRTLKLSLWRYTLESWRGPVLCCIPFVACILVARFALAGNPMLVLATALGSGGLVLSLIYYRCVLPRTIKSAIARRFERIVARRVPAAIVAEGQPR